jgi:predicted transcriptional regulator YdeE
MKKTHIVLSEISLVGIEVRTCYVNEINWHTGLIFPCVQRYFQQHLADKIPHRSKPNTTFCAYTDYLSDHEGAYTYFIGEQVTELGSLLEGFSSIVIPAQQYVKFTTSPEPMPNVVRDAWQSIWEMSPSDLGGRRLFQTDFEIYDERAIDHQKIVMDIYVGVSP